MVLDGPAAGGAFPLAPPQIAKAALTFAENALAAAARLSKTLHVACDSTLPSDEQAEAGSWFKMPPDLLDDTAPPAALDYLKAQAASIRAPERRRSILEARYGLKSSPQAAPKLRILHFQPPGALRRLRAKAG